MNLLPLPPERVEEFDERNVMTPVWRQFWLALIKIITALNAGTTAFPLFGQFANDTAAAAGGVAVGQLYWNGTAVVQRRV